MTKMSEEKISIGALYSATHPLLIWDHPYGRCPCTRSPGSRRRRGRRSRPPSGRTPRNRVVGEMPPEHIFLPIEKAEMFRSWFKILYNDKTGWVNVLNADYKVINETR